ncbi:MAG: 16S rRNA (cytidine(1402)-2'-O)-methyltransferase [Bacilli bacterium]|nr:16S rRNA (cytidine(1402)-2'-O)-methyltransferase [Bacilli bacterium]
MNQKSYDDSASLYLIPTPIGNLDDITVRALKTLESVDFVLCEDTRETGKLLSKYNIKKRLISCHEFNEDKVRSYVVDELKNGLNIGLVTDQGTPIISDPGYIVAKEVIKAGFNVISLPGATAFVPALTTSGIDPSPFMFYGFLNSKESKKKKELESLANFKYTMIFYEAPHRLKDTLEAMLDVFGNRFISISREISKIHEEILRDRISNLINVADSLKGEFVLVVEGNHEVVDYSHMSIVEHVMLYVDDGMSEKDAIKLVAKERDIAKSIIYSEYHNSKGN